MFLPRENVRQGLLRQKDGEATSANIWAQTLPRAGLSLQWTVGPSNRVCVPIPEGPVMVSSRNCSPNRMHTELEKGTTPNPAFSSVAKLPLHPGSGLPAEPDG